MIDQMTLFKMDMDEIIAGIKWRMDILPQLVGQLYPPIVMDEIDQLIMRKNELIRRERYKEEHDG